MTNNIPKKTRKSKGNTRLESNCGYSMVEMLVSICILMPIMAAALQLFSVGVNQHASEQSSIEATQDASAGFNMMMMEIAQAGSHSDTTTTIQAAAIGSSSAQSVPVASTVGFNVGDYVEAMNVSGDVETVRITGVSGNALTGAFMAGYAIGDQIRLFAQPYLQGILPPPGMAANSSVTVSTLRFFGDIYGDGNMYYVEYVYDNANAQITRSMTPFNAAQKGPAIPLIGNIRANSAQFTLHSDIRNVITSITVSLTVENQWETASRLEEIEFSSKVTIPSTQAASTLLGEIQLYGGINTLPPIPSCLSSWIQYEGT